MSYGHASCRAHNPIPFATLIEFRTFSGAVISAVAIENDYRVTNLAHTVCRQLAHGKHAVEASTRVCPAIHEVASSVIIPQWGSVNNAFPWYDALRYGPLALWVFCCSYKDSEVWVTPIDIISLVVLVISYGWSPHTVAVLGYGIAVIGWERLDSMISPGLWNEGWADRGYG